MDDFSDIKVMNPYRSTTFNRTEHTKNHLNGRSSAIIYRVLIETNIF